MTGNNQGNWQVGRLSVVNAFSGESQDPPIPIFVVLHGRFCRWSIGTLQTEHDDAEDGFFLKIVDRSSAVAVSAASMIPDAAIAPS